MSAIFNNLMAGLEEVDAYLSGKTDGCEVGVPASIEVEAIRKRLNITPSPSSAPLIQPRRGKTRPS
jgi:hypothetical protein